MKDWTPWPTVAGLFAGALLLFLARSLAWLPVAVLAALAPPVLFGWLRLRDRIRAHYEAPVDAVWSDALPAPDSLPPGVDAELRELRYRPGGTLTRGGPVPDRFAVYTHEELPVYVLAPLEDGAGPTSADGLRMETFFPDGRLTTLGHPGLERFGASAPGGPRLVQLRAWGPITARALDGQHVGTLKPWTAAGRSPHRAEPGLLAAYLESDRRAIREALARTGWLSLAAYVRSLGGTVQGVLKF